MVWLKLSEEGIAIKSKGREAKLTAGKLVDEQGADAYYVLAICMWPTVYSHLIGKGRVDA